MGSDKGLNGRLDKEVDRLRWGGQRDGADSAWFALILRLIFLHLLPGLLLCEYGARAWEPGSLGAGRFFDEKTCAEISI